jgi:hypothetical protein
MGDVIYGHSVMLHQRVSHDPRVPVLQGPNLAVTPEFRSTLSGVAVTLDAVAVGTARGKRFQLVTVVVQ